MKTYKYVITGFFAVIIVALSFAFGRVSVGTDASAALPLNSAFRKTKASSNINSLNNVPASYNSYGSYGTRVINRPPACPCKGGYTYNALKSDYNEQANIVARNEKFLRERPGISETDRSEANRIILEASEAMAEVSERMNVALKEYATCIKKPENIPLYKNPPNPGRCYRATLPLPDLAY